jgi:hypothetical protein
MSRDVFGNLYGSPLPHKFENRLAPRFKYIHFISTAAARSIVILFATKAIKKIYRLPNVSRDISGLALSLCAH